jgi:hypothetical protein
MMILVLVFKWFYKHCFCGGAKVRRRFWTVDNILNKHLITAHDESWISNGQKSICERGYLITKSFVSNTYVVFQFYFADDC